MMASIHVGGRSAESLVSRLSDDVFTQDVFNDPSPQPSGDGANRRGRAGGAAPRAPAPVAVRDALLSVGGLLQDDVVVPLRPSGMSRSAGTSIRRRSSVV
jgi:hypothetical protein